MLFNIFEKNVIKLKKKRTQTRLVQGLLCFCSPYIFKEKQQLSTGIFYLFPKLRGRERGSNCLFINTMVLKFLEDKELISTALSKNPLL